MPVNSVTGVLGVFIIRRTVRQNGRCDKCMETHLIDAKKTK